MPIKMTDNDMKNTFAFFCDVCGKKVTERNSECLFVDTSLGKTVTPVFTHFEQCSAIYEEQNDFHCGNMHLSQFVKYLGDSV